MLKMGSTQIRKVFKPRFLQVRGFRARKGPPQVVTADEAVSHIGSYAKVYVHGVAAVPMTLLTGSYLFIVQVRD
jgi:hypothetical protein